MPKDCSRTFKKLADLQQNRGGGVALTWILPGKVTLAGTT
jgi:hypothetical protein